MGSITPKNDINLVIGSGFVTEYLHLYERLHLISEALKIDVISMQDKELFDTLAGMREASNIIQSETVITPSYYFLSFFILGFSWAIFLVALIFFLREKKPSGPKSIEVKTKMEDKMSEVKEIERLVDRLTTVKQTGPTRPKRRKFFLFSVLVCSSLVFVAAATTITPLTNKIETSVNVVSPPPPDVPPALEQSLDNSVWTTDSIELGDLEWGTMQTVYARIVTGTQSLTNPWVEFSVYSSIIDSSACVPIYFDTLSFTFAAQTIDFKTTTPSYADNTVTWLIPITAEIPADTIIGGYIDFMFKEAASDSSFTLSAELVALS